MMARLRSWWQKTSKPLDAVIVTVLVVLLALLVMIILGYNFNWSWTGVHGKTLYDWLQLLIIPVVLAVGGYLFNFTTSRNEQEIATDNQREAAMKEYFDKMSELMLHENLSKSDSNTEVRKIARVLTLTVLPRLDGRRKRRVIEFLYESSLIDTNDYIIDMSKAYLLEANLFSADLRSADLHGAILSRADLCNANLSKARLSGAILGKTDLSRANLQGANLIGADLIFADLRLADLTDADLSGANLQGTNLSRASLIGVNFSGANLTGACLSGTNLSGADLSRAWVTEEKLKTAGSLKGAIMPDGTKHA